jgi:hypothetical protein
MVGDNNTKRREERLKPLNVEEWKQLKW